jgi:D-xylose transport system permease protein
MGVVFILLLGEIDLSIGYVSGVSAVITTLLLIPDGNQVPTAVGIAAGLGAGAVIGIIQGTIVARVGVPSFVVTLAGLLAWNGAVLEIIGSRGTVTIQNKVVNGLANDFMGHTWAWVVLEGFVVLYAINQMLHVRARAREGLPNIPLALIAGRVIALAVAAGFVVDVANQNRGVPYVFIVMMGMLVVLSFIASRTKFGRYVYAVGGNAEAARRAGINVAQIRTAVFAISGLMAGLGGIVLASRLSSVDTDTGGGSILLYSIAAAVIGGTSLFGGRGNVRSAILGAILIAMIDNGLGLLNTTAGVKFIVTGVVLLAAVTIDSLSRKVSQQSGRV